MLQLQPPLPADLRQRLDSLCLVADPRATARRESEAAEAAARSAASNTWLRVWRFPTAASAERWNEQWDAVLARPDVPHPAFTCIEGVAIEDPFLDALARMACTILSQEIHAGTPCPYVECGWSYALRVEQRLHPNCAGLGERPCVLKVVGEVRGPDDAARWSCDASRVYTSDTLPASVAAEWCVRHWSALEETYAS